MSTLLEVRDLAVHFPLSGGLLSGELFGRPQRVVRAVDGVSLTVNEGETLGLVGESGCGKTTLGRAIVRLIDPTSGSVSFEGRDITTLSSSEMRPLRRRMQFIFQDPYGSLNPRMTVYDALAEPLRIHGLADGREQEEAQVAELLKRVGLRPDQMSRYPHEFSGGQRQRVGIARALSVQPKFIVADEPVSALDVSIQAQIVNLLKDLQDELGLSFLFVAHDLSVVRYVSHRVAVMYLGRVVETASSAALYDDAKHPYTQALLRSIPRPDPTHKRHHLPLIGDVPSPITPPPAAPSIRVARSPNPACVIGKYPSFGTWERDTALPVTWSPRFTAGPVGRPTGGFAHLRDTPFGVDGLGADR